MKSWIFFFKELIKLVTLEPANPKRFMDVEKTQFNKTRDEKYNSEKI